MAETAIQVLVTPFVEVIYGHLNSLIQEEFSLLSGVRKDLQKLSQTLSTIRLVLEDAEVKQNNDTPTRDWLRKLKDAAYEADDILDECAFEALHPESDIGEPSCGTKVRGSLSTCFDFNQIMFRHKMGKKIKELSQKFDEIAAERSKFHLTPGVAVSGGEELVRPDRETSSNLIEPIVYGRDEDRNKIVQLLLSSQNNLSICPVLGMGGIGKTTLAQLVYNDENVVKQFNTKGWICVSEDFGISRITKLIVEAVSGEPCGLVGLDSIQNRLKDLLNGKKFLIVLDDVWDYDAEKWNKLKSLLLCGDKGSSVIVTTRLQTVVDTLGFQTIPTCTTNETRKLECLSEDYCWSLFKHHAFGTMAEENPNLVEIGLEIVRKCGGVPLAVKALAALLRSKREGTWKVVRDSELWNLQRHGKDTIFPALRLSYHHLPSRMRQCFAYCSIFPKDHHMSKEQLICLWIANGFIQSSEGMELEDVGDEIFYELLRRSFLLPGSQDRYGNLYSCTMHDLMHDLAASVSGNDCSIVVVGNKNTVGHGVRHLSLVCESPPPSNTLEPMLRSQPFLRTLLFLCFHSSQILTLDPQIFVLSQHKCLRVLDLSNLPDSNNLLPTVGHLKHLRYLNLSNTRIKSLPKSIFNLKNLQMLDLHGNGTLTTLPLAIGKLVHLRYLDLTFTGISTLPESIVNLKCLQMLNVNYCDLKTLPASIGNLEKLRHLYLWSTGLTSLPEFIGSLKYLQTLDLHYNRSLSSLPLSLGNLEHLTYLDLSSTGITSVPLSIGSLGNLRSLDLRFNFKLTTLPDSVCDLEHLRDLNASYTSIASLPKSILSMRSLRQLNINQVGGRSTLMPVGIGQLTSLQKLDAFMVSPDSECAGIKELHSLNQLQGTLEIQGLEHATSAGEAQAANLSRKGKLSELGLWWSSDVNSSQVNCSKEVLEALQPHTCIHKLSVHGYPGVILPSWLGNSSALPNLTSLVLVDMLNMVDWFSTEEKLPSVKGKEKEDGSEILQLPCTIRNMCIARCPSLRPLKFPLSLENLKLISCNEATLRSAGSLPYLLSLRIEEFDFETFPKGSFQKLDSLQSLFIGYNPEMKRLPEEIGNLKALKSLEINRCGVLDSLPHALQMLTSLEYLKIDGCKSLTSLPQPMPHLSALLTLELSDSPELDISAVEFQHLIALRKLTLYSLPKLTSLPEGIQHVTTLERLEVRFCKNLRMLPEWLQHLPPALGHLMIFCCHPELHRRCEKDKGEDWHKISRIRSLDIFCDP